ncbi:rod shape-determining protein MreC [Heyndrickxia sp. NPDC080065]|uniref:rod shape-determining protein MreC n=1 Tax=Heyndrickxia sp. NPDC080065 TaxID=3390568 RepID=UPI003D0478D7
MPQFFLNKRLIILLISIILLVALIGYSLHDRKNISKPEQFVRDVVGFGQSIIAIPAHGISDFFDSIKDIKNTYTENKKLKARLDELPNLSGENARLKRQNEEYKQILGNLSEYKSIPATVIRRDADLWYDHIEINKGDANGVKKNMAVITSKGLLGKVISTSSFYSTVELLSSGNPKNRISAEIQIKGNKRVFGLIEGYDEENKVLLLKKLPYDVSVKKGDNVQTSGLGGIFPSGLQIGTVEKLVPDENGLTQTAYVKPYADFYDMEFVQIVDRTAEPGGGGQ